MRFLYICCHEFCYTKSDIGLEVGESGYELCDLKKFDEEQQRQILLLAIVME